MTKASVSDLEAANADQAKKLQIAQNRIRQLETELDELKRNAVVLPCNVGDDIYWLDDEAEDGISVHKGGVAGVIVYEGRKFGILDTDGGVTEIGCRLTYLTREAAEAALTERRENK